MATSQHPAHPRRPSIDDRPATGLASLPGTGLTPDTTIEHPLSRPNVRGTPPMSTLAKPPPKPTEVRLQKPGPATDDTPVGVTSTERRVMRGRLTAMAAPQDGDSPEVARLRAVLRNETLMTHVRANVEQWPPLTDEQREVLTTLLHRPGERRPGRRSS